MDHYLDFVFDSGRVLRGQFIEDTLGQEQLAQIKQHGMDAHEPYGTYLLCDDTTKPVIKHSNGRSRKQAPAAGEMEWDAEAQKAHQRAERNDSKKCRRRRKQEERRMMLEKLGPEGRAEFLVREKARGKTQTK